MATLGGGHAYTGRATGEDMHHTHIAPWHHLLFELLGPLMCFYCLPRLLSPLCLFLSLFFGLLFSLHARLLLRPFLSLRFGLGLGLVWRNQSLVHEQLGLGLDFCRLPLRLLPRLSLDLPQPEGEG